MNVYHSTTSANAVQYGISAQCIPELSHRRVSYLEEVLTAATLRYSRQMRVSFEMRGLRNGEQCYPMALSRGFAAPDRVYCGPKDPPALPP